MKADLFSNPDTNKTGKQWDRTFSPRLLFIAMALLVAIVIAIAAVTIIDLAFPTERSASPYAIVDRNVQSAFETQ